MGPAGPGIVLNHGQRPANRRISWGAAMYNDPGAIAFLRSIGAQRVYLWAFPEYWTGPDAVRSMAALARANHVDGFIADLEGPAPMAALAGFRTAIEHEISQGLDVGLTTYPSWPGLESFRGMAAWLLVQIYGRSSLDLADFERWYRRAAAILPSYILIATFVPPTVIGQTLGTASGYDHYLSLVMPMRGQTWGTWGSGPAYMHEAIARYPGAQPWDSLVAVTIGGTLFGIHDGGYFAWLVIGLVIAIVVVVAAFFAMRRFK